MIRRLYIHNFRCFENFELQLGNMSSILLIGKNGVGKTTIGAALEVFQKIARGTNRVANLVRPKDMTHGRSGVPMRFEIEVQLDMNIYAYTIAFEFPEHFRELRVVEEKIEFNGQPVLVRELAQVRLPKSGQEAEANFRIDWHLAALPIVQPRSANDPISIFRQWLANTLILRPIPSLTRGESRSETLQPDAQLVEIGAWFSALLASTPSAYVTVIDYLKQVMPDLQDIKNPLIGTDSRRLVLQFSQRQETIELPFDDLSDGEKCFLFFALTVAANKSHGPLLCFWDEPDNYLAPSEVGPSIMELRRAFRDKGQVIVTSHNAEAVRGFSDENTFVLQRNSHFEPPIVRLVEDYRAKGELQGDFVSALLRGDIAA